MAAPAPATFPGRDGRISFDGRLVPGRGRGFVGSEIFAAKPDGSDVRRLTFTPGPRSYSELSEWSPDGERIAFDSNRVDVDGRENVAQIYVMNADGSGVTQLTRGPGFQVFPSWSPDAGSLAIAAQWGDFPALGGIWIIPASDPDGVTLEEARRVTTIPARVDFDIEPQFSPDGSSIAFTRFKNFSSSAIHRVGIDGSGLERLTPWHLNASHPDWSPDGQRIAFDSGDVGHRGSKANVYVMRADGSGRRRLTNHAPIHAEFAGRGAAGNPVWSPSGTRIMYTRFFPEKRELVAMNPDGSHKHVVVGGRFGKHHFPNKVDWGTHP